MKEFLVSSLVLLAITGCAQSEQSAVQEEAEGLILPLLRDPESARFKEPFLIVGEGEDRLVCGTVNAKNAMGGYTGDTPYMVWKGKPYIQPVLPALTGTVVGCCAVVARAMEDGTAPWHVDGFGETCAAASTASPMPYNFSAL